MFEEKTYKRCACKGPLFDDDGQPILTATGEQKIGYLEKSCPKLSQRTHGSWYYSFELPPHPDGSRRPRAKKGGYRTQKDAAKAATEVWTLAEAGIDVLSNELFSDFLDRWLAARKKLAETTSHGYQEHCDLYLKPHLGAHRVRDIKLSHCEAMFAAIAEESERRRAHREEVYALRALERKLHDVWKQAPPKQRQEQRRAWEATRERYREALADLKRPSSPATWHRIRSTLSSALKRAEAEGLVAKNWARLVELPAAKRPKPLVWTPAHVRTWQETGKKPSPVMVWTPEQCGRFLDFVAEDRLFPLWHLIMFRGLRRGESVALDWDEHVDLDAGVVHITEQIVTIAYEPQEKEPKADSVREVLLDSESRRLLSEWRIKQEQERKKWSAEGAWIETGRVFTRENGEPYHPQYFTDRFDRLVELSGLPPIRLHDLRHEAATLAFAGNVDPKVVQEMLGHSSHHFTLDTYTSVLPEIHRKTADAGLDVVRRSRSEEQPIKAKKSKKRKHKKAKKSGESAASQQRSKAA